MFILENKQQQQQQKKFGAETQSGDLFFQANQNYSSQLHDPGIPFSLLVC